MRILLVDSTRYFPSTPLFLEALVEVGAEEGHEFHFVDEAATMHPLEATNAHRIFYRLSGKRPLGYWAFNRDLVMRAKEFMPDVVLVVKGALISPASLDEIRRIHRPFLINYATDDPYNRRSNNPRIVENLSRYDLVASPRKAALGDIERAGTRAEYVRFGYKPDVHFPESPPDDRSRRFECDVAFIGAADADRTPFFEAVTRELPHATLALYGGDWQRFRSLAKHHRGGVTGQLYRYAVAGAKICVNLVRRANRDDHVMRTFEIPACGGFMLAEDTDEHRRIFGEDGAAYFRDPQELADQIRRFLLQPHDRERIAGTGREVVTSGHHSYADRLKEIFGLIDSL